MGTLSSWSEQQALKVHEQLNLVMDPLDQEIRINSIGALKILGGRDLLGWALIVAIPKNILNHVKTNIET